MKFLYPSENTCTSQSLSSLWLSLLSQSNLLLALKKQKKTQTGNRHFHSSSCWMPLCRRSLTGTSKKFCSPPFSAVQASAPTPAGLRVERPKTWGRSAGSRRSRWGTKLMECPARPLLLLRLLLPPPKLTSPNSWKTSSAYRLQMSPLTAWRWVKCGVGALLSFVTESERCVPIICLVLFCFLGGGCLFVWSYAFFQSLPEPQWLHHGFMRAESLAGVEWKKNKSLFPVRIPQNDRAPPHLLGHVTPLMT